VKKIANKEEQLLVEMANGSTVESLELEMLSGKSADDYQRESEKQVKPFNRDDLKWNKLFHLLKTLLDGADIKRGK